MAGRHAAARAGALAFGGVYAIVTLIGLIDGEDVLGLLPVNPADNILHILLTVAALGAGLASTQDAPRSRRTATG